MTLKLGGNIYLNKKRVPSNISPMFIGILQLCLVLSASACHRHEQVHRVHMPRRDTNHSGMAQLGLSRVYPVPRVYTNHSGMAQLGLSRVYPVPRVYTNHSWMAQPRLSGVQKRHKRHLQPRTATRNNKFTADMTDVIAKTYVDLQSGDHDCRLGECNFGNLITDAVVYEAANLETSSGVWAQTPIAIISSKGIRTGIDRGDVTIQQVVNASPKNLMDSIIIEGRVIIDILEHSVKDFSRSSPSDAFLQVSGLWVVFNLERSAGQRVVDVQVRCSKCPVPEPIAMEEGEMYRVFLQTDLIQGRGGYEFIVENLMYHERSQYIISDMAVQYIKRMTPLSPGVEGRIRFTADIDISAICSSVFNLGDTPTSHWLLLFLLYFFVLIK